jgi:chromosome segregation ATPase
MTELEKEIHGNDHQKPELIEERFRSIVDLILEETVSGSESTGKEQILDSKFTHIFLIPKIKYIESSLASINENLRRNEIDIEKITYAIKSHEKQILVLDRFIEQQSIKNEQLYFEITNLKLSLESIQGQLSNIMNFMEQQNNKNELLHRETVKLSSNIEVIHQQMSTIIQSLERQGNNFEKHIDEMEAFFLRRNKENSDKSEQDIERYKFLVKIGYWIAGSLGALSFIAMSLYSVATEKAFPVILMEIFKNLPWK